MRSIGNTRKITHAMEMVSASKLSRVKAALFLSREYFLKLESVLADILGSIETPSHPLLEKRQDDGKVALCVMASDTGLCSNYNQNIFRAAEEFLMKLDPGRVKLIAVGKESLNYFKRRGSFEIADSFTELRGRYTDELSGRLTAALTDMFLKRSVDKIYIIHTHFDTTLRHYPKLSRFLNIEFDVKTDTDYIAEPDMNAVLDLIIKRYLAQKIRLVLLDTFTSEHASRMIAMKTATDNAEEMMDMLTLMRNKARQAAITKEVLEIASAAEAVKG